MKIISAIGGSGSTFVIRALEKSNYRLVFGFYDPYPSKIRLEKKPPLINAYNAFIGFLGGYRPSVAVLRRPDAYWTDWQFNKTGEYNPRDENYLQALHGQKTYVLKTRHLRSAGFNLDPTDIREDSLPSLIQSYVERMRAIEREKGITIVLISGHWGEYGLLKQLGLKTIYLIRDPFNSIISHSKPTRHQKDYLRRGLKDINSKEWIDAFLSGPHHYWIRHAQAALSHPDAVIIRYDHFVDDWKQISDLIDISQGFKYQQNEITRIFTKDSIAYIQSQTGELCNQLGFIDLFEII
jgi:hypothetical protein